MRRLMILLSAAATAAILLRAPADRKRRPLSTLLPAESPGASPQRSPRPDPVPIPADVRVEAVDSAGDPVKLAWVRSIPEQILLGRTDARGVAFLDPAAIPYRSSGFATLCAGHPDFAPALILLSRGMRRVRKVLQAGGTLLVSVRTDDGSPVKSATIRLSPDGLIAPFEDAWTTDENGSARIPHLPAGTATLLVTAPGYVPRSTPVAVADGEERELHLTIETGSALQVMAVDPADRPVAGARVELRIWSRDLSWQSQTGPSGEAFFENLPRDAPEIEILASHPLYRESVHTGPVESPVTIRLEKGAALQVRIHDSLGMPVSSGEVVVREEANSGFGGFLRVSPLCAPGTAEVGGLPAQSPLIVSFRRHDAPAGTRERVVLTEGEKRTLSFLVDSLLRITVEVRDENGEPLGGTLWLEIQEQPMVPDPSTTSPGTEVATYREIVPTSGIAAVEIPSGHYRIAFEVDSGGRSVRELELRSSGTLSWVVPSGRRLLGTVRDGRGEPVSSLALAWVSADGTSWTVTAEDGSFVLSRVSPSEGRLFALDTFGGEALLYQGPPAPQPLDVIYSRWQVLGRVENPDSLPQLRGTFAVRPLRSAMFSPSEIRSLHRPVAISADGRFEMTLPEGEWVAEILPRSADAPALVFRTGPAHAGQELTIVLPLSSTR